MSAAPQPNVVITGGGPVGCVTALSCAARGARVAVLEANPKAAGRFAGEWLHPRAARIMRQLGVPPPPSTQRYRTGEGFVVFPEDGTEPVVLPYPDGVRGFACEHETFVNHLRDVTFDNALIDMWAHSRLTHRNAAGSVDIRSRGGASQSVQPDLLVGADGRKSTTRRLLGFNPQQAVYSRMAGILLHDVELPYEGYGHVFLGCPGPLLAYRVAENAVRLCLDVPANPHRQGADAAYLWDAYAPALPEGLRRAYRRALEHGRVAWTVNRIMPRAQFGRDKALLVGDAVGHYHPLTAVGMTLGFGDALVASNNPSAADYRRTRLRQDRVAEMLAVVLYEVFAQESDDALAIRRAIYAMWRHSPAERRRTMRYLAGEDGATHRFAGTFVRAVSHAARQLLTDHPEVDRLPRTRQLGGGLAGRLRWLSSGLFNVSAPVPTASAMPVQDMRKGAAA